MGSKTNESKANTESGFKCAVSCCKRTMNTEADVNSRMCPCSTSADGWFVKAWLCVPVALQQLVPQLSSPFHSIISVVFYVLRFLLPIIRCPFVSARLPLTHSQPKTNKVFLWDLSLQIWPLCTALTNSNISPDAIHVSPSFFDQWNWLHTCFTTLWGCRTTILKSSWEQSQNYLWVCVCVVWRGLE